VEVASIPLCDSRVRPIPAINPVNISSRSLFLKKEPMFFTSSGIPVLLRFIKFFNLKFSNLSQAGFWKYGF
jgi:hypothetical protein